MIKTFNNKEEFNEYAQTMISSGDIHYIKDSGEVYFQTNNIDGTSKVYNCKVDAINASDDNLCNCVTKEDGKYILTLDDNVEFDAYFDYPVKYDIVRLNRNNCKRIDGWIHNAFLLPVTIPYDQIVEQFGVGTFFEQYNGTSLENGRNKIHLVRWNDGMYQEMKAGYPYILDFKGYDVNGDPLPHIKENGTVTNYVFHDLVVPANVGYNDITYTNSDQLLRAAGFYKGDEIVYLNQGDIAINSNGQMQRYPNASPLASNPYRFVLISGSGGLSTTDVGTGDFIISEVFRKNHFIDEDNIVSQDLED